MPSMTTLDRLRTADEAADVRRYADEHLAVAGDDEYSRVRVAAILATLDWTEGVAVSSPFRELAVAPTRAEIVDEAAAASDCERELMARRERATWPGVVNETLQWVLGWGPEPI